MPTIETLPYLITCVCNEYPDIQTWWVGFSGGLDSTVLLHALQTTHPKADIRAIHIDHQLQDQNWSEHCQRFCDKYAIPLSTISLALPTDANEADAREARYDAFTKIIGKEQGLMLAHHANDQAETILQRLMRGSGPHGLSGIPIQRMHHHILITRPLLSLRKKTLHDYATAHNLSIIEDPSNLNPKFLRNICRHHLLPMLEKHTQRDWIAMLNRTATHCEETTLLMRDLAKEDHAKIKDPHSSALHIPSLLKYHPARIKNILRYWIENEGHPLPNHTKWDTILNEVLQARADSAPLCHWQHTAIRRYQDHLWLLPHPLPKTNHGHQPFCTWLQGQQGWEICTQSNQGIDPKWLEHLEVRTRKGGEVIYWRGHHRVVKKLLHAWQIPPWQRAHIPLIYHNDRLIAVASYAIDPAYLCANGITLKKKSARLDALSI